MSIPLDIRRRTIVRGTNWVGDAIMITPALHLLRRAFEGSHITLMVRPWVEAVYRHNPDIDELWVEDDGASTGAFLKAARRVREGRFDFGVAFPNSFRSALLLALGQVRHRVGYKRAGRSLLLTRPVEVKEELLKGHEIYYYLHLVEWLSDMKAEAPRLVLNAGDEERRAIDRLFAEERIDRDKMIVGMAPGAINSTAKLWPAERFAELADKLHREAGAEALLLGSAREKETLDRVQDLCRTPVCNLAGRIGLAELIALMERLDAFVGNDSGAMHAAAAMRVPTVAIFGPTDWRTTAPFSPMAKIVRHPVDCAPCMLRECPIDHPCMKGVTVDDAARAFAELAEPIRERMKARREKFSVRAS